MLPAIDTIITRAIERRVFPGAVVRVICNGSVQHDAAYGSTMYADPGSQPVTTDTVYDIASLTKMFTATAALQLVEAGHLELDQPAARYLPALRARGVTVRHLLTHTSGLELRLSTLRDLPADKIRAAIYATEPTHPPGTRTAYVNISTLLLGDVVAQVAGQPLDHVIHQRILEPLDLQQTRFCLPVSLRPAIVPTERDDWRGGLIQGTVHDESAHALGGVAGHAGLFSTAADLGSFGQMWLAGGTWEGEQILQAATAALATSHQRPWLNLEDPPDAIRCGLGWMLDRPEVMGRAFAGSYGHTGFTGPVLLVMPACRAVVVLLCNRTYPRRSTERSHFPVMTALVDAVREACPAC
jgi:CubicO group peptidase (beta-lactamase class C family)